MIETSIFPQETPFAKRNSEKDSHSAARPEKSTGRSNDMELRNCAPLNNSHWLFVMAGRMHGSENPSGKRKNGLFLIGINNIGEKHLLISQTGITDSFANWIKVLKSLKQRKMNCPILAIAEGNLAFWEALESTFPRTNHQRYWATAADGLPPTPNEKEVLENGWQISTGNMRMAFKLNRHGG